MGEGGSVGEYALLHGKKRSATVRTLTKTYFAIMERESFEEVMYNIKMKESDVIVQFLNQYDFIRDSTYNTKAQLGYRLKEKKFIFGQEVYAEGSNNNNVYFIESGQFVITKDLYIHKDKEDILLDFRRAFPHNNPDTLKRIFDKESICLYNDKFSKEIILIGVS